MLTVAVSSAPGTASSVMVPRPVPSAMPAPTGLLRTMVKFSDPSAKASSVIGTLIVWVS